MAEKKNYYDILGVKPDATEEEIRAAYKKLVKQYHPDLHPDDPQAAEKFKELNEANEVLSDKQKRAAYDYEREHPGMGGPNGMGGGFSGAGFSGFSDIFDTIFQGFGGGRAAERDTRGDDIRIGVTLSFMDAAKGCRRDISYFRNEPCSACRGTGAKGGTAYKKCAKCNGIGQVQYRQTTLFGQTVRLAPCPDCGGRGTVILDKCPECRGKGSIRRETKLTIDIPAGADTNSYMRRRGYGQASSEGGEPGDLIVVFRVEPHKLFERKDMDLYVDVPIPFLTAALGGKVLVPGLDDAFEYEFPEGTQPGQTFTLRGKGIKGQSGTGNLYLRAVVETPVRLTKEQKAALAGAAEDIGIRQFDKSKKYSDTLSALYGKDAYQ